jgi:VanZ family protein
LLRIIFFILWGSTILLLTCASNISGLSHGGTIQFRWVNNPDYLQLLQMPQHMSQGYIIQKSGHILSFFILALFAPYAPYKTSLWLFLFACITEILQLYFGRSGRFIDMGYDTLGIFLGMLVDPTPMQTGVNYRNVPTQNSTYFEKRN